MRIRQEQKLFADLGVAQTHAAGEARLRGGEHPPRVNSRQVGVAQREERHEARGRQTHDFKRAHVSPDDGCEALIMRKLDAQVSPYPDAELFFAASSAPHTPAKAL